MSNTNVRFISAGPAGLAVARACQAAGLDCDQIGAKPQALTMARLIRADDPDLTAGVGFVASDRHASDFDSRAWRTHLRGVFDRMGWTPSDRRPAVPEHRPSASCAEELSVSLAAG